MWQFLQTYGFWIVFGIFFLLMMRMHRGGMGGMHGNGMGGGCGMGMGHDQSNEPSNTQRAVPLHDGTSESQRAVPWDDADVDPQNETFVRDVPAEEEGIPSNQYPVGHHTGR